MYTHCQFFFYAANRFSQNIRLYICLHFFDLVMSGGPVNVTFPNQFPIGNPENVHGKLEIHLDDLLVESLQRKSFREIQKRRKAERRRRAKKRDGSSKDNQPDQEDCFIDA